MVVVDEADEEDSSTARRHRTCVVEEEVVALHLPPFTRRVEEVVVGVTNREEGGRVRRFPSRFRREILCRRRRLGVEGVATPRTTTTTTTTMGGPPDGASPPLLCLARTKTSARPRRFPRPRREFRDLRGHPRVRGAALPPVHALVLVLAQRRLCSARNRSRRCHRRRRLLLFPPPVLLEEDQRSIPSWTTPSRSSVRLSRSAPARARATTLLYRVH